MTGSINEVECVSYAVNRFVVEPDGVGFDRDSAFAFEVHVVEDLVFHIAFADSASEFEQPIGQRRLAVIDVRNDGEITNTRGVHLFNKLQFVVCFWSAAFF